MGQEGFSHTSNFWFDHYWWVLWMILFGALLLSSFTHRKASYCQGDRVLRHDGAARFSHWFNAAGILLLLFHASWPTALASATLIVATLGAFAGEIAGRHLFYRVVPLGLAGNFFAGNQRH